MLRALWALWVLGVLWTGGVNRIDLVILTPGLTMITGFLPMLKVIAGSSLRANVVSDERADLCILPSAGGTTY